MISELFRCQYLSMRYPQEENNMIWSLRPKEVPSESQDGYKRVKILLPRDYLRC